MTPRNFIIGKPNCPHLYLKRKWYSPSSVVPGRDAQLKIWSSRIEREEYCVLAEIGFQRTRVSPLYYRRFGIWPIFIAGPAKLVFQKRGRTCSMLHLLDITERRKYIASLSLAASIGPRGVSGCLSAKFACAIGRSRGWSCDSAEKMYLFRRIRAASDMVMSPTVRKSYYT